MIDFKATNQSAAIDKVDSVLEQLSDLIAEFEDVAKLDGDALGLLEVMKGSIAHATAMAAQIGDAIAFSEDA